MFADIELAARIERAECRMLADSAAAAERRRPGTGVFRREVGGGVATYTGPGSPLNKLAGLGFEELKEWRLEEVEEAFRRRGTAVQAEVSSLGDPLVLAQLVERGYRLKGFENVSGRLLPAPPEDSVAGVEVRIDEGEDLGTWLDVLASGFAAPDTDGVPSHESFPREALEQPMGDMAAGEGFLRYLAFRQGQLAGGAGLRLSERVALLCGAATLPEHRRRGVQTTLLTWRLADAAIWDCELAVVTTQPGSKSQLNVQRQGFSLLYTRAVLVKEVA